MLMKSDVPKWYLIQCKAREDHRALEHLERQEFRCYQPVRSVERIRQGQRHVVSEPLFPGYLFIHLDRLNDNWHPIRSTRGVLRWVAFNGEPTPVPDQIVDGIRERVERSRTAVKPHFNPNDRVMLMEGPFAHLEAIFVATRGEDRVLLLLNILQQEQRLEFPLQSVKKITQ